MVEFRELLVAGMEVALSIGCFWALMVLVAIVHAHLTTKRDLGRVAELRAAGWEPKFLRCCDPACTRAEHEITIAKGAPTATPGQVHVLADGKHEYLASRLDSTPSEYTPLAQSAAACHVAGEVGAEGQRCLVCGLVLSQPGLRGFRAGATIYARGKPPGAAFFLDVTDEPEDPLAFAPRCLPGGA